MVASGDEISELRDMVSAPLTEGTTHSRVASNQPSIFQVCVAQGFGGVRRRSSLTSAVRIDSEGQRGPVFDQQGAVFVQLVQQLLFRCPRATRTNTRKNVEPTRQWFLRLLLLVFFFALPIISFPAT